jgi:predicted Zn finger-like uncharacterized protein
VNQNCPSCGALYNVAEKDIGRKLKCKKCGTSLKVTDKGLETDSGTASSPPVSDPKPAPVSAEIDDADEEEEEERSSKKKKKDKDRDRDRDRDRNREPGVNPLVAIGGIPTVLFGIGVFFVIVFTSLPVIGDAGSERAALYYRKLELERDAKIKDKEPKKKQSEWTADDTKAFNEAADKIREDYRKQIDEAKVDAARTVIANRRDLWMERYGLMFGFLFLSFGCIGYLRTEQPLVLKIVAAVVLALMLLMMFDLFAGGCRGRPSPQIPIPGVKD